MKKILPLLFTLLSFAGFGQTKMIITGTYDGPLSGGHPKGVELFTLEAIDDLSLYGIGSANNGGGTDSVEFSFPAGTIDAGTFIYVCADSAGFHDFFGFAPDFAPGSPLSINGDDAIELFLDGAVVDIFGDINMDGTGEPWDHLDGWAYRQNGTGPDGSTFVLNNWRFSGVDAFDGESSNSTAATPFPIGTYSTMVNTGVDAVDDYVTTQINTGVEIKILENDQNVTDQDFVDFFSLTTPHGSVDYASFTPPTLFYTPNQDYCGDDMLMYMVCVGSDCDTANVFITVECPLIYEPKTIGEVTMVDSDGNPTADENLVALTGVVHSINFRPGGLQFALIDSNNDGITVFSNSDDLGYTVLEGDELTVKGEIGSFRGSLQVYADSVNVNSSGNPLFDPTVVTALNEDTESQLVKIENLTIVNSSEWTNSGSGFNVDVTDGNNIYTMRIVSASNLFGTNPPVGSFNLTGIGGQFDFDAPYLEGYQVFPRYTSDIELVSGTENLNWGSQVLLSPNPVFDNLNITGVGSVDRFTIFNSLGQVVNLIENKLVNNSFSVSYLNAGIYFLQIEKEGQSKILPFVKQ